MKYILCSLILALVFAACSKKDHDNTIVSDVDIYFMQQVAYSNYAAMDAATIALENANDSSVKLFAANVITTQGKIQNDLEELAVQLTIQLPDTADAAHQAKTAHLATLSGHQFDTAYINTQLVDFQNTINLYNKELSDGNNAQIIQFARLYLPDIVDQWQDAFDIQATL